MKILVIGGMGNIGLPVTHQLIAQGHQVVVMGRRTLTTIPDGVTYLAGDSLDVTYLNELQNQYKFDIIVNFAIQSVEQAKMDIDVFSGRVKQFVYISSVTVLDREKNVVLDETSPCGNPYSEYAQMKLDCEQLFLEAYTQNGFPVTIIRPSQTYSKEKIPLSIKGKSYWSVIDRMIKNKPVIVHGDGTSTWVSMHSEDFARAFTPLVGNDETLGEIIHITSDEVMSWNGIYQEIAQQLGLEPQLVHVTTDRLSESQQYNFKLSIKGDKQYSVVFNNHKLLSLAPNFESQISMSEGIKRYLAYMESHPELKVSDPEFDEWCDNLIEQGVLV